MFKHWMEILRNYDNGYFDWLFYQKVFPLRESKSMSGNGIGFTREELFRSAFTELQVFLSIQLKTFQNSVDELQFFFLL